MGEDCLVTDALVEAVSAFELVAEELPRLTEDPYRWKWVIIALHSGVQGLMVSALQGSHGLHTLKPEDATRWLEAHERGGPYPHDLKLDGFLSLYKKVKGRLMLIYSHSQKFTPQGTQGRSVRVLNDLRNEYIHFTPRVWVLELAGLPQIATDCLSVAEFLAWESNNVIWKEEDLSQRLRLAFVSAKEALSAMKQKNTRLTSA